MKTKYLNFIILSFIIIGSIALTNQAFAQETTGAANIQYPIEELGNCQNQTACRTFCDKPENTQACVSFAEENNLMSQEEVRKAKKFMAGGQVGPGGCRGKDECEAYCGNTDRIDECIAFAEKNDMIPPEELAEAKKIQAAIKRGVKPPPCGNKKACDVYCDSPEHMEECVTFGIEAGFIQGKELEDVQKMLAAVKRGVKPPPCKGKEACDEYCSSPDNMEVCMNFALEAGFMNEQEKADSQKMLQALKKGIKPPACKGKEECDAYCAEESHFEECTNFAVAAGFMSEKDAAMARKTGGKSPGNCKGKEECEAFCNNPDNQETCFNFAKEHGLIPEEDLRQMEEGKQKFKESLTQMPPEVADCFKSLVGEEMFEKFKTGAAMPSEKIGDQMRQCFEKMGPSSRGPGGPGAMPPGGEGECCRCCPPEVEICIDACCPCPREETGPGGCKTPEECQQKFQPGPGAINPGGQMMPQQAGPGGCKGPDECRVYCESHPEECKNSGSDGERQFTPEFNPDNQPGGQFPPTGPGGCQTPEECQQMQNQIRTRNTCEGENCQFGPPPSGQQPPIQQNMPPQEQQFPQGTQNPPEGMMPPAGEIVPPPTQTPPPTENLTPPVSSFVNPQSLLGLMFYIFTGAFRP